MDPSWTQPQLSPTQKKQRARTLSPRQQSHLDPSAFQRQGGQSLALSRGQQSHLDPSAFQQQGGQSLALSRGQQSHLDPSAFQQQGGQSLALSRGQQSTLATQAFQNAASDAFSVASSMRAASMRTTPGFSYPGVIQPSALNTTTGIISSNPNAQGLGHYAPAGGQASGRTAGRQASGRTPSERASSAPPGRYSSLDIARAFGPPQPSKEAFSKVFPPQIEKEREKKVKPSETKKGKKLGPPCGALIVLACCLAMVVLLIMGPTMRKEEKPETLGGAPDNRESKSDGAQVPDAADVLQPGIAKNAADVLQPEIAVSAPRSCGDKRCVSSGSGLGSKAGEGLAGLDEAAFQMFNAPTPTLVDDVVDEVEKLRKGFQSEAVQGQQQVYDVPEIEPLPGLSPAEAHRVRDWVETMEPRFDPQHPHHFWIEVMRSIDVVQPGGEISAKLDYKEAKAVIQHFQNSAYTKKAWGDLSLTKTHDVNGLDDAYTVIFKHGTTELKMHHEPLQGFVYTPETVDYMKEHRYLLKDHAQHSYEFKHGMLVSANDGGVQEAAAAHQSLHGSDTHDYREQFKAAAFHLLHNQLVVNIVVDGLLLIAPLLATYNFNAVMQEELKIDAARSLVEVLEKSEKHVEGALRSYALLMCNFDLTSEFRLKPHCAAENLPTGLVDGIKDFLENLHTTHVLKRADTDWVLLSRKYVLTPVNKDLRLVKNQDAEEIWKYFLDRKELFKAISGATEQDSLIDLVEKRTRVRHSFQTVVIPATSVASVVAHFTAPVASAFEILIAMATWSSSKLHQWKASNVATRQEAGLGVLEEETCKYSKSIDTKEMTAKIKEAAAEEIDFLHFETRASTWEAGTNTFSAGARLFPLGPLIGGLVKCATCVTVGANRYFRGPETKVKELYNILADVQGPEADCENQLMEEIFGIDRSVAAYKEEPEFDLVKITMTREHPVPKSMTDDEKKRAGRWASVGFFHKPGVQDMDTEANGRFGSFGTEKGSFGTKKET